MQKNKMNDLSEISVLIMDENQHTRKYSSDQSSTIENDDSQTIITEQNESDRQSDASDFDIIQSIDDIDNVKEGI